LGPVVAGTAVTLGIVGVVLARRRTTTRRLGLDAPEPVDHLDVQRYMGTWYEISRIRHRFEPKMAGTTVTYFLRNDGRIDILGRSRKKSLDGKLRTVKAVARTSDDSPGKFEVSFMRPFWADHWVLDVGPNYEYAVVGHPSRDYLWILSREPTLARDVYDGILDRLEDQNFPIERLERTLQAPAESASRRKRRDAKANGAPKAAGKTSAERSAPRQPASN
jgi:apolipoprotein D and lipocalin family protein